MVNSKNLSSRLADQKALFCSTTFLKYYAQHEKREDPKTLLDRFTKVPVVEVVENFRNIIEGEDLQKDRALDFMKQFISDNFHTRASSGVPPLRSLSFDTEKIFRPNFMSHFFESLAHRWVSMLKQTPKNCMTFSSLLELPKPFPVPGGRFDESYYWDNLWTCYGLLLSGLSHYVRDTLINFTYLINTYNIIPNGSSVYFLNRSQPPIFGELLGAYILYEKNFVEFDDTFARKKIMEDPDFEQVTRIFHKKVALDYILELVSAVQALSQSDHEFGTTEYTWLKGLNKEYHFWVEKRYFQDIGLFHYDSDARTPRYECYRFDVEDFEKRQLPDELAPEYYRHITAVCESGHDFTSRFVYDPEAKLSFCHHVCPVDLNTIIIRMQINLGAIHFGLGRTHEAIEYFKTAKRTCRNLNKYCWNEELNCWFDYDTKFERQRRIHDQDGKLVHYATNYFPLWAFGALKKTQDVDACVKGFLSTGLLCTGGVKTSTFHTGMQWDAPNCWAPIQDVIIRGLLLFSHQLKYTKPVATTIAASFFSSVYLSWKLYHGTCYEKYDADLLGKSGGGGEYLVQSGFGWTNGTVQTILYNFQDNVNFTNEVLQIVRKFKYQRCPSVISEPESYDCEGRSF